MRAPPKESPEHHHGFTCRRRLAVTTRAAAFVTLFIVLAAGVLLVPGFCSAQEPDSLLTATLDFDPDALNLKSNGRWVTCYIELSEGYDPNDIDPSSVSFMDSIPAVEHPCGVCDYDEDEIEELMVKFPRADVGAMLAPGDSVEIWVSAQVRSLVFAATDTIRVFWPGEGDDPVDPEDGDVDDAAFREGLRLEQNHPNPFNPKTVIAFSTPTAAHVRLDITDVAGRLVVTLVDGHLAGGDHAAEWNGKDRGGLPVASGVYFSTVTARGFSETRKVLLLK